MFSKTKKIKVSIDFTESNYNILTAFAKSIGESNSTVMNYLVSHFLQLSPQIKRIFAKCCVENVKKEQLEFSNLGEYEKEEASKRIDICKDLTLFFTDGKGYVTEDQYMKKIKIIDGYVIVPNDWIVVENRIPAECKYVGVIEIFNNNIYKVPHFVFFSDCPISQITEFEQDIIFTCCEEVYPDFRKIRSMQLKPIYDENKNMLNAELYIKAPIIGLFQIRTYGIDISFPAGAMIVRTS
ncbi:MAG: hypothetical protein IJZ94_05800 [Clostridia bacterium]|nr:hypothetical protein [Clostridia bacterium]